MLSVFDFHSQSVRALIINGDPWFVLADVLQALGTSNTVGDTKRRLIDIFGDEGVNSIPLADARNVVQETTIIPEYGVTYIVSNSRTDLGKAMNVWLHKEVLPSIRKIGKYDANPKELTRLEILKLATEAEEGRLLAEAKAKLLEDKIVADAPYTALGQVIETAKGDLKVGEYAKIIGLGQNKLFELLRDKHILSGNKSNWNVPYQKYIDSGYFRCTERITPVGLKVISLITPKGQIWIQKQLANVFVLVAQ